MVSSVWGGGAAGVVVGEPGIGKTALLHQVARHSDARVVWVCDVEGELVLPFAAAAELLTRCAAISRRCPQPSSEPSKWPSRLPTVRPRALWQSAGTPLACWGRPATKARSWC